MPKPDGSGFLTGSKHGDERPDAAAATVIVAVDAGGTSTRAVVVDAGGDCLGYGTGPSGNPTSAGAEAAAAAIAATARQALAAPRVGGRRPALLLSAMAGAGMRGSEWLTGALAASGLADGVGDGDGDGDGDAFPAIVEADLTAVYLSGTLAPVGTALILGTGAIAARVRDGRIERVADGLGWLLGDDGSGFWVGRRAVRRVAAALDGREPPTAMTAGVLSRLGVAEEREPTSPSPVDRPATLDALLHAVYARRPVELAALAPAVFEAADAGDEAAGTIVREAASLAATALRTVGAADGGGLPVVLGGGVLTAQPLLADAVRRALAEPTAAEAVEPPVVSVPVISVPDGVVGAAVLALRALGVAVDEATRIRIEASLRALR